MADGVDKGLKSFILCTSLMSQARSSPWLTVTQTVNRCGSSSSLCGCGCTVSPSVYPLSLPFESGIPVLILLDVLIDLIYLKFTLQIPGCDRISCLPWLC